MKKLLFALLIGVFTFVSCSDDDEGGEGYLTSIESVKSGILGSWKSTTGGVYYTNYASNGTKCDGFEPNGNWETCTTYELFKSGSNYIIRIYDIGGTPEQYVDWKITVLDNTDMATEEIGGSNRKITRTRVK